MILSNAVKRLFLMPMHCTDIQKEILWHKNRHTVHSTITDHSQWCCSGHSTIIQRSFRKISDTMNLDGALCFNGKMIISPKLLKAVLGDLLSCHSGIDKTKSFVRKTIWWVEINPEITDVVKSRADCFHEDKKTHLNWILGQQILSAYP